MPFWTNLFNHQKTYLKPKKPLSHPDENSLAKPKVLQTSLSTWPLQEQIRISKTITLLKRHKYRLIQHRKTQLKTPPKRDLNENS